MSNAQYTIPWLKVTTLHHANITFQNCFPFGIPYFQRLKYSFLEGIFTFNHHHPILILPFSTWRFYICDLCIDKETISPGMLCARHHPPKAVPHAFPLDICDVLLLPPVSHPRFRRPPWVSSGPPFKGRKGNKTFDMRWNTDWFIWDPYSGLL